MKYYNVQYIAQPNDGQIHKFSCESTSMKNAIRQCQHLFSVGRVLLATKVGK